MFEELSLALLAWSNLVNLEVGAMSAAAQVGGTAVRSVVLFTQRVLRIVERTTCCHRKSQQLRELFPSSSSSWLPWLSANPALSINNEHFKEQLRQVQAYLMSLRQKEILPRTGGLEINFPFAALISERWAERLGLKAPVSPLVDELYLDLLH